MATRGRTSAARSGVILFGIAVLFPGLGAHAVSIRSMEPGSLSKKKVQLHKIIGSGFTEDTAIYVGAPAFVGNHPSRNPNSTPVRVADDGTWLTVYIRVGSQYARDSADVIVKNPDGSKSSKSFPVGERSLRITALRPEHILEGQVRLYKIFGAGFTGDTAVYVDAPAFVGSNPDKRPNSEPAQVASDGSWLKIYISVSKQPSKSRVKVIVKNPNGARAEIMCPFQR